MPFKLRPINFTFTFVYFCIAWFCDNHFQISKFPNPPAGWQVSTLTMVDFLNNPDALKDIVSGIGACMASNRITVDGQPVGFMYRERPEFEGDSGWRFLAGDENDEYMANDLNSKVFDVNTIANYDIAVVPYLKLAFGIELERIEGTDDFQQINA